MANFDEAYNITCKNEGKYDNDPDDVGGETYKGVARSYYPDWGGWKLIDKAKEENNFPENLENNSDLQTKVRKLFKNLYWNRFWGDKISNQSIANEMFDTAINLGASRAIKYLQIGLNILNRNQQLYADIVEDGVFGKNTLRALNSYLSSDEDVFLLKVINILQGYHYIKYMKESPIQEKYARGWLKRVEINKI